jgi:hypothetical protein
MPSKLDTRALTVAAVAGLLLGASCKNAGANPPSDDTHAAAPAASAKKDKACCKGLNDCKGKGGCAVKNDCKHQGGCDMHCPS